jgi:hypothetical protein
MRLSYNLECGLYGFKWEILCKLFNFGAKKLKRLIKICVPRKLTKKNVAYFCNLMLK